MTVTNNNSPKIVFRGHAYAREAKRMAMMKKSIFDA